MDIAALYQQHIDPGLEPLPELASLSHSVDGHTMGEKLVGYIRTKFSTEQQRALAQASAQGWKIRIIGAYSGHEAIWLDALGEDYPRPDYSGERLMLRRAAQGHKRFNKRRPYFLVTQERAGNALILNVVTFPSREYTQQVAGLVTAAFKYGLVEGVAPGAASFIEVMVFPQLEQKVGEWTGLRDALRRVPRPVLEQGIVLFGYVEEIAGLLKARPEFARVELPDCASCSIDRVFEIEAYGHKAAGFHLLTFGFHHTYWGSASARLLEEFLRAGVQHTIYFAKLGGLKFIGPDRSHPLDASKGITGGLVAPRGSFYCIRFEAASQYRLSSRVALPNLFSRSHYGDVGRSIHLMEAAHISVPSVVGETRALEVIYRDVGPATVDNEISFMAEAVHRAPGVTFDCVHYVTDFVTTAESQHHDTAGGLDQDNRARKIEKLKLAANFLLQAIELAKEGTAGAKSAPRPTTNQAARVTAATRDYLSLFGAVPEDFPPWMHPAPEYQRLGADAVARQAILASAIALPPRAHASDLLADVLSDESRNLDVSGPPGGGRSMVANALYYELLERFQSRRSAIRPLLLELKRLERKAIEAADANRNGRAKFDQRKFLQSELAKAGDILAAEAAMGPVAIIVNCVDTSSPLFALLEERLSNWRKSAGRANCKLIAFWRKSEWIVGGVHDPQEHPGEYRVSIDSAALLQADRAPLLAAICRVYRCSSEQFVAAFDKAMRSTGKKSPTLRVIVHFLEGKAQQHYFADITRYRLGANGQTGAQYLEAARAAYSVVVDRNPEKSATLTWERRLVTGSDEITAHFAANFIYRRIVSFAEAGRRIGAEELARMDQVFPHSINHQLKQIVNKSPEEELRAANLIKALWMKLSKTVGRHDRMHFKSVLMYICGRFTSDAAKDIGRKLLREALQGLAAGDLSGGPLSLHRTAHISLIFLGEDGTAYFRYLRSQPQYDAINRGFHMTYYQDQDYWNDPRMDTPDRDGPFARTYSQLQQLQDLQLRSGKVEAVHAVTAYTVISLIVNRYRKGKLEETLSHAQALRVLSALDATKDLPSVVCSYARWAHHYLSTGVSVIMQALIGLKREARAGWNFHERSRTTLNAESVADHTLSAILLARMFLPERVEDLDASDRAADYSKAAVIQMLEVHDLAEGLLGDKVNPQRNEDDDDEELGALIAISALAAAEGVPVPVYAGSVMEDALTSFQEAQTLTARLARDFDKMENLLQLAVYRVDPRASIPDAADFERDVRAAMKTRTAHRIWDGIWKELKDKELGMLTSSGRLPGQRRRTAPGGA